MDWYAALKQVHVGCVIASGAGFAVRGGWMLLRSARLQARWVRILPHVVDTVLLASAVTMAVIARLDPFVVPWLAAKLGGLLIYIVLGALALRYGRSYRTRAVALLLALFAFAYVVSVALTRDPRGPAVLF